MVHLRHPAWGEGEVVQEMHSSLEGGLCIVRISFEDGVERSFLNDMDSEMCCYFAGIRIAGGLRGPHANPR